MNWQKIKTYARILGSIIGIGIFTYLVIKTVKDIKAISAPIVFNGSFLVSALLVTLMIYLMQMVNYEWMITTQRSDSKLKDIMVGYAFSLLHKYIPGYIWGYFSRADWYERKASISATHSWMASILEVLTTITTSLSIWITFNLVGKGLNLTIALMVMLVPIILLYPLNLLISFSQKIKRADPYLKNIRLIPLSKWALIIVNSYCQWILFGFGLWMICQVYSLKIGLSITDLTGFVYSFARAWVSGFLTIFVPNGIGVREVVLTKLLIEVNYIGPTMAILLSTSYRLLMMVAEFVWGLLAVFLNSRISLHK